MSRMRVRFATAGMAAIMVLTQSPPVASAATFVVTVTSDDAGSDCVDPCSLRQAITAANANAGADTIAFAIPGAGPHVIAPTSQLPSITTVVTLDGTTQPGVGSGPRIVIDGGGQQAAGIVVSGSGAGGTTVRGLQVVNFMGVTGAGSATPGNGIFVSSAADVVVEGNYLGTDGTADLGNHKAGVWINQGARAVIRNNLISGNGQGTGCCSEGFGVQVTGSLSVDATITGNLIGTNADGTTDLGNATFGVWLESHRARVGGSTAAERNVISGNDWGGVAFQGTAVSNNVVVGNYIGTNASGTAALPNGVRGVLYNSAAAGNRLGGSGTEGNVIVGQTGVHVSTSTGAVVRGNLIGVAADGTTLLSGTVTGVDVQGGSGSVIAANTIAGTGTGLTSAALSIRSSATSTTVTGNAIRDNLGDGIVVSFGATNNTIGGTGAGEGNTITGNRSDGISVTSGSSTGNRITGNSITASGSAAGDLGIDLGDDGVTANDAGDGDTGPNQLQNFPVITTATTVSIQGTLDAAAGTYRLEFYRNATCDNAGNGEGGSYAGGLDGVAPGPFTFAGTFAVGDVVTATATDSAGNTSEFSACRTTTSTDTPSLTVNVTDDTTDADGCTTVHCSLREAVTRANSLAGPDVIGFNITAELVGGAHTIRPTSPLPVITGAVTIDGMTEPDAGTCPNGQVVVIDGANAGSTHGIWLAGEPSTVRGLVINGFDAFARGGIYLKGSGQHTVQCNKVGTDVTGSIALGNDTNVLVESPANAVGGPTPAQRNLISGSTRDSGVLIQDNASGSVTHFATGNVIEGNWIGTDATGTVALGNRIRGVMVNGPNGNTVIGNVVSGNIGIGISVGSANNVVQGNLVGTTADGSDGLGNTSVGISVGGANNTIGGPASGEGNTVADGNHFGMQICCQRAIGNVVEGNRIGTNAAGTQALGNALGGLILNGAATNNTIGGTGTGEGNLISGNAAQGILIEGAGTTGNRLIGNRVGTNAAGTAAIPNTGSGVYVGAGASANTIGGLEPGQGNQIAHNAWDGVTVAGTTVHVAIHGNRIDANGDIGIDLNQDGVTANDAGDADTGPNDLKNFPVITSATPSAIEGTFDGPAAAHVLEFFRSETCDGSHHGQGADYLGALSGQTPGAFSFAANVAPGDVVTATVTDASGNTSEFSACATVEEEDDNVCVPPSPENALVVRDRPADLRLHRYESDTCLFLFPEQAAVTLGPGGLAVDASTVMRPTNRILPAGSVVTSYLVHTDKIGATQGATVLTGTHTFPEPVIGLIYTTSKLNTSDNVVGYPEAIDPAGAPPASGFYYPDGARDIELNPSLGFDQYTIAPDGRTVTFTLGTDLGLDNLRVVVGTVPDGRIVVEKQTTPDGSTQRFAFSASYDADGFDLADDERNDSGPLEPGTYSVSETVPEDWSQTGASCSNGFTVGAVDVDPGETVTCLFVNEHDGLIDEGRMRWCTPIGRWVDFTTTRCGAANPQPTPYGSITEGPTGTKYVGTAAKKAFPYVYTPDGSFPVGDFVMDITVDYDPLAPHGSGLRAHQWTDATPSESNSPFPSGERTCSALLLHGDQANGLDLAFSGIRYDMPAPGARHTYRLAYLDGRYMVFVDGSLVIGPIEVGPQVAVDRLWIGYPKISDWGAADWSDFLVESVTIDQPEFTDIDGNGEHDGDQAWPPTRLPAAAQRDTDADGLPDHCDPTTGPTPTGTIVVTKVTDPANVEGDFTFGGAVSGTIGHGERLEAEVAVGSHTVTEVAAPGFDLEAIACDDDNSTGDPTTRAATFRVDAGETINCTFTNVRQPGRIVVTKDAQPDSEQDFAFTAGGGLSPGSFSLDDNGIETDELPSTFTFDGVEPGSGYSIAETPVSGWSVSATCDDGSSPSNIAVGPGETVSCTFVNDDVCVPPSPGNALVVRNRPADLRLHRYEDDNCIFLFPEQQDVTLGSAGLRVDASAVMRPDNRVLPEGSVVSSYLVHTDKIGATEGAVTLTGTFEFPEPVIGVIFTTDNLNASDPVVGYPETLDPGGAPPVSGFYYHDGDRKIETRPGSDPEDPANIDGDYYRIAPDGRTVTFTLGTDVGLDNVRVIVGTVPDGRIVVRKDARPDSEQDFAFTATGLTPSSFVLEDDGDEADALASTMVFEDVAPGTGYAVGETELRDWTAGAGCDNGFPVTDIAVDPGETVTCTFVNETVCNPDDPADTIVEVADRPVDLRHGALESDLCMFLFTEDQDVVVGPSGFGVDRSEVMRPTNPRLPEGSVITSFLLHTDKITNTDEPIVEIAGSYEFPAPVLGFIFTRDRLRSSDGEVGDAELTYDVTDESFREAEASDAFVVRADGRTVDFTLATSAGFDNVRILVGTVPDGRIIVEKQTDPDASPQAFDFAASYDPDGFTLRDGESNDSGLVKPGVHSVAETVPDGWKLRSASCSNGFPVSAVDVDPGETVTCTFQNQQDSHIIVTKETTPDGDLQSFDFTASYDVDGFSLTDGQSNDSGDLDPGVHRIAEIVPMNWALDRIECTDGHDPAAIDLAAGETVRCTFYNHAMGEIIVRKETLPDGSSQAFPFTASYDPDGFTLRDGESNESGPLPEGTYSVAEAVPADWDLTNVTCTDNHEPAAIDLAVGETVTCTFTNRQRARIIVDKVTLPAGSMQVFDFVLRPAGSSVGVAFTLTDAQQPFERLVTPGTYSVTESVPAGWDLVSGCEGQPASEIDLAPGATVRCTFTNTQRARIRVDKVTTPPNDPQSFRFVLEGGPDQLDIPFDLRDADPPFSLLVRPGTYSVTETVPVNWQLNSVTCSGGRAASALTLQPGDDVLCTFRNGPIPLKLTKSQANLTGGPATPSTVRLGDTVRYTVSVRNDGTGQAAGVVVADLVPERMQIVSDGICTVTSTTAAGTLLRCPFGQLDPGQTKSVTIDARVIFGTCEVVGTRHNETLGELLAAGGYDDGVTDAREVICGLGGNDNLFGQGGNDVIFGDEPSHAPADLAPIVNRAWVNEDDDQATAPDANETVRASVTATVELHTAGEDGINGGTGDDELWGQGLDDRINGLTGRDTAHGGTGNDTILGDDGPDFLYGDAGADAIVGGDASDTIRGGDGNDVINGSERGDLLYGDAGNDEIRGDGSVTPAGPDEIHGGPGSDQLIGGGGNDQLFGEGDNDFLRGDEDHDELWGGLQSDILLGGDGEDRMAGDEHRLSSNGVYFAEPTDGGHFDHLNGGNDNDLLYGQGGNDCSSDFDDVCPERNRIFVTGITQAYFGQMQGGGGVDRLHGGSGADRLDGGQQGGNALVGGTSTDFCSFGPDQGDRRDISCERPRPAGTDTIDWQDWNWRRV